MLGSGHISGIDVCIFACPSLTNEETLWPLQVNGRKSSITLSRPLWILKGPGWLINSVASSIYKAKLLFFVADVHRRVPPSQLGWWGYVWLAATWINSILLHICEFPLARWVAPIQLYLIYWAFFRGYKILWDSMGFKQSPIYCFSTSFKPQKKKTWDIL